LCEKFGVYIGNFGGTNAKSKIKNVVLNKFKVLCEVSGNSTVNCSYVDIGCVCLLNLLMLFTIVSF